MNPMPRLSFIGLLFACSASLAGAADYEHFEKRVRPVLVERCYECHSAAAKKLKGGLFLDSKEGWARGGDSGPAIVPGDPERSLLIKAVRWADADSQMPPKNKLPQAEIDALVAWVKSGAPDPREASPATLNSTLAQLPKSTNHWSYQPLKTSSPPVVKKRGWPRGDLDRFLLSTLEARGIKPAVDAEPAVLCRRLYFDLIGLPPTPEQIKAFTASAARNRQSAIGQLVDELLASPRFGEQWGRHWLDVVRFGESLTLRGFIYKEAWRYRDYVIDSFNRDTPFDQFIREQLAGDLLPHQNVAQHQRQNIAATFLALGNWNLEEQDKRQLDMDVVDEQLDTLGKAFLGQTIGCARCHDHKFDPISTRDYYALAGILKSCQTLKHANVSEWIEAPLPVTPDLEQRLNDHELAVKVLQEKIKSTKDTAKRLAGIGGESKDGPGQTSILAAKDLPGVIADSAQARKVGEWKHSQYSKHYIGDGYWHDDNSGKGAKTLSFASEIVKPGRYEVRLAYVHGANRATNIPVTVFHADGEATVRVNQQEPPPFDGRFVSLGQFRFEANGFGYVLVSNDGTEGYVTADAVQFLPMDETLDDAPRAATNEVRAGVSVNAASNLQTEIKSLEAQLKRLQETGPRRPMTLGVKETGKAEDIPIHIRGSVHNLGALVPRGFLAVASSGAPLAMPEGESGRRELAGWIASAENPLTARVFVNRAWLWLTGEGIVRSPDNFGTTGDAPTNPALLDHLAARFIEDGWSVKTLVRHITLSRAYQLSSRFSPGAQALDPQNQWQGRGARRRLTAEQLRDAMLAVSGRLEVSGGGQTYPANLSADFGFVFKEPRRSVYAPVFRNALPELFEVFDFAPPSMVTGRRNISTVPTQALFLLNNPFVREQAQAAAQRLLELGLADNIARIEHAHLLALGRWPTAQERRLALTHLGRDGAAAAEAWTELFHALFASADFRYLN